MMRFAIQIITLTALVASSTACTDVTDQVATSGTQAAADVTDAFLTFNQTQDGSNTGSFLIDVGTSGRHLDIICTGDNGPTFTGVLKIGAATLLSVPDSESITVNKPNGYTTVCFWDGSFVATCKTVGYRISGPVTVTTVTDRDVTFSRDCH